MASLTGNSIASTYKQLLKVTSEGIGDDASAKYIEDGLGTDSALSISTTRIGVGTNAPDTPLTVRSTTTAQIHLLDGSDATNLGLSLGFDDAGNTTSFISSIYNNDANRFDIRMKGNDTSDAKLTVELQSGDGELYDLSVDKHEMKNLWNMAEAAQLQAQMTELLWTRPGAELTEFDMPVGVA